MASDVLEESKPAPRAGANYKGFVAGVFSGIAKLSVGHPFDTVKVRLQTTSSAHFRGPLQCVLDTVRKEGFLALYKGATPPLVGWMFMDSVMLGSLTVYRRLLSETVFHAYANSPSEEGKKDRGKSANAAVKLPWYGHGMAGIMAGSTVSMIAAPVEHLKARLQTQYAPRKADRLYTGPIDALHKIYNTHGVRGVYHGLSATLIFRSFFFFWWSTYDIFTRFFEQKTDLSAPAINFWAGGLSAQIFWLTSYPSDVVKQRVMTDPLGGALGDGERKFKRWSQAARAVYREGGPMGFWRGFLPCFLRAFPANAMALVAFEGVMRVLPEQR